MKKRVLPPLIFAALLGLLLTTPPATAVSYVWIGPAGGNWKVPTNWSPAGVPGGTDIAAITTTGNYTVTVSDNESVGTLTLGASTADGTVQTLNLSSGNFTVNNAGTGTAQGTLNVSGAALSGAGALILAGPLDWTSGTIAATVLCDGGTLNGSMNLDGALVNSGTLAWNGNLFMNGGTLTNLGTINFAAGSEAINEGNSPDFDNEGQFNVSGTGTSTINIPFNNHGMVAINGGTLNLAGGGTETNSFTVASGATLQLGGGTFTFNPSSSISGAGNLTVSGGTAGLGGTCDVAGAYTFSGGTANVTGACTITGPLLIPAGTLNLNGSGAITPATVSVSGGALEGSQPVQVQNVGGFTASSGTIAATVLCDGGTLNGSMNLDGALVNSGTLAWNGNLFMNGGTLTNLGTINFAAGSEAINEGNSPDFDNEGQFNVSGTGISTINIPFNNHGMVAINGGTLNLAGGGTETNSFTVASGATLQLGGGTFTFNPSSSISGAGNLTVSGGTAGLGGMCDVAGAYTFSGGTANVTGACTITGPLLIPAGTLNLNGSGAITPATVSVSGGILEGGQPVQVQNVGGFTASSGTIAATVLCDGGTLNGSMNLDGALVNSGTLAWNGNLFINGGTLTNLGTINFAAGSEAINEGNSPDFDNEGQFNVSGTGTSTINIPFNNHGMVAINGGTLNLAGGGTETNSFTVASGATLQLGGGTFTFNPSSSISGAGNLTVSGGTAGLGGTCDVAGAYTFSGGTANVTGACTITGPLLIPAGTLNLNGSGAITPATVSVSGGILEGGQPVQVQNVGGFTASSGTIAATVLCDGGTLNGSMNLDGALVNSGTLAWNGNLFINGGTLTNLGTINFAAGSEAINEGNSPDFDNEGQFNVSGTGTSTINIPFNNHGMVAINGGTLNLAGGGTETNSFTVASGATLQLGGGTFTFNPSSSISGAGNLTVSGGTAGLGGTCDVAGAYTFSGGTANVTGACTITGPLLIPAGTLNLNGSGAITPATVSVSGGILEGGQPVHVQNVGGFTASSGTIAATVLCDGGTLNGSMNLDGALVNSGTLAWNGNLFINGGTLTNLGTINFAAGSEAINEGNSPDFDNEGQFNVSGTGISTINIPFNNHGTVAINSGTLSLTGPYSLTNGTLNFSINGATNFGALKLSGEARLTCRLGAAFNGYSPNVDDTFGLITYASETGVFSALNLPSDVSWNFNYGTTVFSITVYSLTVPAMILQVVEPPLIPGAFTLLMLGPIGSNYLIQAASDPALKDWVTLTNFISVDTSIYFTDTTITNRSSRVFRGVLVR